MMSILVGVAAMAGLTGAATAATATPPGNRANYTVVLMRNAGATSFVRLAEYSLRADGSARADYWAWNSQTPEASVASGFTNEGCGNSCPILTTDGFQNPAQQLFGTWSVSGDDLTISWTSGNPQTERWKFTNQATATRVELASHPTATNGWGWGSRISFGSGLSAQQVLAANTTLSGRYIQNAEGVTTNPTPWGTTSLGLRPGATVKLCSATCISVGNSANKAYLAGSGADRRMYYNHEQFAVHADPCIVHGHLKPALQVLDDNGAFRGLIMVEASLYADLGPTGSTILGIYDLNDFTS
ncbi:hypothetical protein ACWT_3472 [Actinoplanes sp. SE50]|nr:hypothetical protein ACPL_3600 [Actinoplanes sp. SE50/110]ATO82887.1 hypothetical protein ACWT_3472 [Actinoplanes sp. SE50]SLM00295.1 hypothetical protein ACSP50_3527 [Actinoplanes sp. SE50/110]